MYSQCHTDYEGRLSFHSSDIGEIEDMASEYWIESEGRVTFYRVKSVILLIYQSESQVRG